LETSLAEHLRDVHDDCEEQELGWQEGMKNDESSLTLIKTYLNEKPSERHVCNLTSNHVFVKKLRNYQFFYVKVYVILDP
jgi:hypothetical protein